MAQKQKALDLTIIGAGMIVTDVLLPSALQLQRTGIIGEITVCDMRESALRALKENEDILEAFPNQSFKTCPEIGAGDSSDRNFTKKFSRQKTLTAWLLLLCRTSFIILY